MYVIRDSIQIRCRLARIHNLIVPILRFPPPVFPTSFNHTIPIPIIMYLSFFFFLSGLLHFARATLDMQSVKRGTNNRGVQRVALSNDYYIFNSTRRGEEQGKEKEERRKKEKGRQLSKRERAPRVVGKQGLKVAGQGDWPSQGGFLDPARLPCYPVEPVSD